MKRLSLGPLHFLLATAGDPRQAPEYGPGGCQISPLDIGGGD